MPYPKPIPDDPSPLPGGKRGTPGTGGGGSTGSNGAPSGSDPTNNSAFTSTGQATVVTIARGRVKLPATLIEKLPASFVIVPAWATVHYQVGQIVTANGNAYRALSDGTAVNAPSGGGSPGSIPTVFTTGETVGRAYIRVNLGSAYIVLVGGVCGLIGPTGTGASITDSTGIVWAYLGPVPFAGVVVDAQLVGLTIVVDMVWQYLQAMPYNVYFQSFVLLLCEGPTSKVRTIWQDKLQTAVTDPAGLLLPGGLEMLPGPDAGGQVLPGGVYDSTGYQHSAVLVPISASGISTGTQTETPDYAVEIDAVTFDSLSPDMNAADHVLDQMTHSRRGFGWPSSRIDSSVGGSGAASLRTWSDAKGVRFSHVLDSATAGVDIVSDYANTCNTVFLMSQGKLKAVPLDDTPTSSPALGAVNYVPNNTARYNITPNDVRGGQPVSFTQTPDPDRKNVWPVQYYDRAGGYVQQIAASPVLADIQRRGIVPSTSPLTLPFIFPDGTYPTQLSRVAAHASLYVCNKYTVTVGPRFLALEPGDIVTIPVGESISTFVQKPVRITQVDKGSDFWRTLTCVDYPAGIAAPAAFTPQAGDGLRQNGLNTIGSIPSAYQSAAQTNQFPDNLFPGGTGEINPPSNIVVLNDGTQPEWDFRANLANQASFTGSFTGSQLSVAAMASGSGPIAIGQRIDGVGVLQPTYVASFVTGSGGVGTYGISQFQTLGSGNLTTSGAYAGDWVRQIDATASGVPIVLSVKVPCSPGEMFTFEAQGRSPTIGGSGVFGIAIEFFNNKDQSLGGPPQQSALQTRWALLSMANSPAVAAPSGTTYVKASIFSSAGVLGIFDSIVLRRAVQPQHVTPGAHLQGLTTDSTGATVWAGDTGWTAVTFAGTFANLGSGFAVAAYRKDPNSYAHLKGIVTGGTSGGTIGTFPAGYRPLETHQFAQKQTASGVDGYAEITIAATGVITASVYSATGNLTIDCSFLAEQ